MARLNRGDLARQMVELAQRIHPAGAWSGSTPEDAWDALEAAVASAEAARLQQEAQLGRMAVALDNVAEGVLVADAGGEVVYRNSRAESYYGARHGEAIIERALDAGVRRAIAGEVVKEPVELWGPPRRTLELSVVPLEDGDQVVGALGIVEDVSERRRLEAMRRDFVANISHELKTPVGALGVLAEAISLEQDPEVVRRLSGRLLGESSRLGRIIDDLLDLSRIEAEEQPAREPVPVSVVIGEAVERVRTKAEQRALTVEQPEEPLRATVVGDRRQLVSALHNLLENAVKYSDDGSLVQVKVVASESDVAVSVVDHGIGIPSRDLERIFERFYRVDRARARDTGGTGLGLAIVRHVCHNHGGEVYVESREGEGSTFTLHLPAGPEVPPATAGSGSPRAVR